MTDEPSINNGVEYDALREGRFIGRRNELAKIDGLAHMDATQVALVTGDGGAGKTRLLKEVLERCRKSEHPFFVAARVIDFYHTPNHSVEGLMDAIYRAYVREDARFVRYVAARERLDRYLAEPPSTGDASTYPALLQAAQDALIDDINELTETNRPVLVLDTAEKLIYEITEVERTLGLTQEQLGIWCWLSTVFLPRLRNALVIIAGRPESEPLLGDLKKSIPQASPIPLGDFDEVDALAYIADKAESLQARKPNLADRIQRWTEQDRADMVRESQGRPILLALTIDCLAWLHDPFMGYFEQAGSLEEKLTIRLLNTERPEDEVIRKLARTQRGMTPELLARLLDLKTPAGDWDNAKARQLLDSLKDLSFVKSFGDNRTFLHDRMYELINEYVFKQQSPKEAARDLEIITTYTRERLADLREKLRASLDLARESADYRDAQHQAEQLQAAMTEDLHYQLRANEVLGLETYYRYAEEALQASDMGLDAQLRSELLAFAAEKRKDQSLPPSEPLQTQINADESLQTQINADSAIRWVRRHIVRGRYRDALDVANAVSQNDLVSGADHLSQLELAVWKLGAAVNTEPNPEAVEAPLRDAIKALEALEDSWRVSCLLAHAYNGLGYSQSMVGRQHAAIESYIRAVPLWRKINLEAQQANTLNNLAFALSNVGNFDRASRLAKDALEIRERLGNRSAIGLSLNTRALIEMQHGDLHQAQTFSTLALQHFQDTDNERGLALAKTALAEIRRRIATEGEDARVSDAEALLRHALADARGASDGFVRTGERVRNVDALIQLGCTYRDLMYVGRGHLARADVEELTRSARETFSQAWALAGDAGLQSLDVWVREAWTDYYLASYYRRIGQDRDEALAEEALARACASITAVSKLIQEHYPGYELTKIGGRTLRASEQVIMPVLTQLAKIELLKGQMDFNRYENCRAANRGDCSEVGDAIREGIEHYTLSLEYDDIASPGFNFRDMRRAKDRIYERLKKLNVAEWQSVYQAVEETERAYGLEIGRSAMSRFIEQNFGSEDELKPLP